MVRDTEYYNNFLQEYTNYESPDRQNYRIEDKMYLHIGSRLPLSTKKWTIQIDYNDVHMKTMKSN